MVKTAVILAAGMGTRFAGVLPQMPKGCYPLGGRPLVQRSIDTLQACGIEDIIIVTGHLPHFYEEMTAKNSGVRTVHNPSYADTGSMLSLYSAREASAQRDILVLESDIIYEKRAVSALLASPAPSALMLSDSQHTDDDYFFELKGDSAGRVTRGQASSACGQMMGITKMSAPYYETLCQYFEGLHNPRLGYEYAIEACPPMGYVLIEGLVWSEIDSGTHLKRVEEITYPLLIQKGEP